MKDKYVKLRPNHQTVIKIAFNSSLIEILKITQKAGITSNEIDNLFRCKKMYKFKDGTKVNIQKTVPEGHNLYSFIAHVLSDCKLDEPITQRTVKNILSSVAIIKKALLLDFNPSKLPLLKKLEQVSSLELKLLSVQ